MATRGRRFYTTGMQKFVSDYDALSVNSCGVLPNGLQLWKWIAQDCYVGTQEALVEAGVAQASWFPDTIAPGRRAFSIQTANCRIKLVARSKSEWDVEVPVSAAERERRESELNAQLKARHFALASEKERLWADEDAALRRSITLAPPVELPSLSESELRHLRVLRTVGQRTRGNILDFTERLLLVDARYGELAQRQAPRLSLVVDNARAGQ